MNLILLLLAARCWQGRPIERATRVLASIAALSLEMQVATWSGLATLDRLVLFNGVLAVASFFLWARSPTGTREPGIVPPWPATVALAALVVAVSAVRPVTAADPYHLLRVEQIQRIGTLAYDPAVADVKVNALAGSYELVLADLRVPGTGLSLVRLNGLFGLALYLVALSAIAEWLPPPNRWMLVVLLVIPVVYDQLVLVKNDLFGAVPALIALAWLVARLPDARSSEVAWAAALVGFAVGVKVSSVPIAVVFAIAVLHDRRSDWTALAMMIAGGIAGAVAGGLLFTILENVRIYGGIVAPYAELGNQTTTPGQAMVSIGRFAMSLVDMGIVTPRVWPGRGGWGGTFGLPFVWALVVMAVNWQIPNVRRAAVICGGCFVLFAALYPDADVAQRMMIAPGVLIVVTAVWSLATPGPWAPRLRTALSIVIALSAAQIARSAYLYTIR
ncbi:MAG TPA: hypothetical protein VGF24_22540 [Vicinamibacterales bacterium]